MKGNVFLTLSAWGLLLLAGACKGHESTSERDSVADSTATVLPSTSPEDSLRMEAFRTCDLTLLELHGRVKKMVERVDGAEWETCYEFSPEGRLTRVNGKDPFNYKWTGGDDYIEYTRDRKGRIESMCLMGGCTEVVWDGEEVWKHVQHFEEGSELECQITAEDNGIVVRTMTMEREGDEPWERTGQNKFEFRKDAFGNWVERTDLYNIRTLRNIEYYEED